MRVSSTLFLILAIALCSFMSCSGDDTDSPSEGELDYPRTMTVFCQGSLNEILRIIEYEYDNENLITETVIQNGKVENQTTRQYNSNNKISFEKAVHDRIKIEQTFFYNENNQLVNILFKVTDYNINGEIIDETERETSREYENNELIKEWHYWGAFSTYEYSGGKITTKIDHNRSGKKHHITTYTYDGDLLAEEKKMTYGGILMYHKTYKYNSENLLVQIKDDQNIIELNEYINSKLVEKRTYYFGIDPGYDVCYGNYLYQYEY